MAREKIAEEQLSKETMAEKPIVRRKGKVKIADISKHRGEQLAHVSAETLMPLPFGVGADDEIDAMKEEQQAKYECSLDGISALNLPKPETKEEEDRLVKQFLNGIEKLLSKEDNWTFLLPLTLSLNYCAKCLACSDECPVYQATGKQEIYRPNYRAEVLRRAADLLDAGAAEIARTISLETGKPISEARGEAGRLGEMFRLASFEGTQIRGETLPLDAQPGAEGKLGFTLRIPTGVVVAITPYNYPGLLVVHKIAPALAAGNAVILKPASQAPLTALAITAKLIEAGLPETALQTITGGGREVGMSGGSPPAPDLRVSITSVANRRLR